LNSIIHAVFLDADYVVLNHPFLLLSLVHLCSAGMKSIVGCSRWSQFYELLF